MEIYDLGSDIQAIPAVAPAAKTSTATGATIDTYGFSTAAVIINVGAVTTLDNSNYFTLTVQASDDSSNSVNSANIPAAAYVNPVQGINGSGNSVAWTGMTIGKGFNSASTSYSVGVAMFDVMKRYITPILTATSSPSAIIGVTVILAGAQHGPSLNPASV